MVIGKSEPGAVVSNAVGSNSHFARPFNFDRRKPLNVLVIEAAQPLVRLGGSGLVELREDVFDLAFNANCHAHVGGVHTYATAMSGGEPYSVWS